MCWMPRQALCNPIQIQGLRLHEHLGIGMSKLALPRWALADVGRRCRCARCAQLDLAVHVASLALARPVFLGELTCSAASDTGSHLSATHCDCMDCPAVFVGLRNILSNARDDSNHLLTRMSGYCLLLEIHNVRIVLLKGHYNHAQVL